MLYSGARTGETCCFSSLVDFFVLFFSYSLGVFLTQSRPSHRLHIHSFSERFRNYHTHFDLNSQTLRDGQNPAHFCPTLFTFDSPCRCAWPFPVDKHMPRQHFCSIRCPNLYSLLQKLFPIRSLTYLVISLALLAHVLCCSTLSNTSLSIDLVSFRV